MRQPREYWIDPFHTARDVVEKGKGYRPEDAHNWISVIERDEYDKAIALIDSAIGTMNDPDGEWTDVLVSFEAFRGLNNHHRQGRSTNDN